VTFLGGKIKEALYCLWIVCLISLAPSVTGGDITNSVFGLVTDVMPAAFGDFNSDELTDLFVVRGKSDTVEVMLAREQEPLLQSGQGLSCTFADRTITSVVPGNFDGDARLDVMVTVLVPGPDNLTDIFILWGGLNYLNCSNVTEVFRMKGQPLMLDYNHDMIVDLFGEDSSGNRTFLLFNASRTESLQIVPMKKPEGMKEYDPLRVPHSHAFLDLTGDCATNLLLSTEVDFELWTLKDEVLSFIKKIKPPAGIAKEQMGQSLFLDLELTGKMYHLLPVCFDKFENCTPCRNSTLFAYVNDKWHNLNPVLKDSTYQLWGFYRCDRQSYRDTVTLRAGDFNMDGYPDILATLSVQKLHSKVFLLTNVESPSGSLSRTYAMHGDVLAPMKNETTLGAFYDLYQDGILDVILYGSGRVQAFRNTLDYDANFVKVMVLTGLDRGGNLPGPSISYRTTTQEGDVRAAVTAQLPQSAHFSLGLPYTMFGLGRTPNFVDTLMVGVAGHSKAWTQIIPNSQMVVIPHPLNQTSKWRAQLFITPSKMILLSVAALTGTCVLIIAIIGALYWKERREDRIEKLQEAHRFHFDAM
jgi:integrin alpha FG-GAP repeat containing protein 1